MEGRVYLLVHTMTITDSDFVVQCQFFHTFTNELVRLGDARLVGKRVSLHIHPRLRGSPGKLNYQRLCAPNLRTLMKRNSANIKHHLRTIHISSQKSQPGPRIFDNPPNGIIPQQRPQVVSPKKSDNVQDCRPTNHLTQHSSPEDTITWLTANRFDRHLQTFASFSGADMLRMSREDLIQICGNADGIRLHNALHLKAIAPKLKLYVCRENSTVFNAIFLSAHSNIEFMQKLAALTGISCDQVRDIYLEGPQGIHVQLSNDLLQHVKEETMFTLEILQENDNYIFLLKRTT